MSVTKAPPIPFGRHLGVAARTSSDLLDKILVDEAERFETWGVLNLIATGGPGKRRDELERELVAGLQLANAAPVLQLLGQMERLGLIRFDAAPGGEGSVVELTPAGQERFEHLLGVINEASARALSDVDPEDVETTLRVLRTYREGALALLAG